MFVFLLALPTQSTNYVLSTDYDNYAIVWSCRNVEPPIPVTGLDFLRNLSHTGKVIASAALLTFLVLHTQQGDSGTLIRININKLAKFTVN